MKRKIILTFMLVMVLVAVAGCGSASDIPESTETATEAIDVVTESTSSMESIEASHEHTYIEDITTEATCTIDGEVTYTCDCGDTYIETITATGHSFENYISNNDATYTADGTETAACVCGETDTRTAEGSMLTYTYTDMDANMYAQQTVNVRSMPSTDSEKIGSLSVNDEVKVTGQCVETSWYRIEFDGNVAYVSNDYLSVDKVAVQADAPAQSSSSSGYNIVLKSGYSYVNTTVSSYDEAVAAFKAVGIEPWVTHEENGTRWCYAIICHVFGPTNKGNHESDFDTYVWYNFNGYDWGNRLGTKDGRVYVEDVNGGSWSIQECISNN